MDSGLSNFKTDFKESSEATIELGSNLNRTVEYAELWDHV